MEEIVYNSVSSYFKVLSKMGYLKDTEVDKLLFLVLIEEFMYHDFRGMVSREDYQDINRALYMLFGKSCLIPYPDFVKIKDMNKLHLGDLSELAARVKVNEDNIKSIQDTAVVKKLTEYSEIEDGVPSVSE